MTLVAIGTIKDRKHRLHEGVEVDLRESTATIRKIIPTHVGKFFNPWLSRALEKNIHHSIHLEVEEWQKLIGHLFRLDHLQDNTLISSLED